MNEQILEKIKELKIVPVVKLDRAEDAVPLAEALCKGGLPIAEITFRTEAAEESIKKITAAFPDMLVGAGTIINTEQARRAVKAGASFIVSPGTTPSIIEFCLEHDIPVFPGACTPSEVMTAMNYQLPVVKFFPAKQYGGLDTIKSLSAPFPAMRFMPTGGVSEKNLSEFLAFDKIIACGGSWMVNDSLINTGNFQEITRLTAKATALCRQGENL